MSITSSTSNLRKLATHTDIVVGSDTTDPSNSPQYGQMFYNTVDNLLEVYLGAWMVIGSPDNNAGIPATTSFAKSYLGGDPTSINTDYLGGAGVSV